MIINVGLEFSNTATTIGIRMPNVPQLVPVANARKHPIRKIMAGRKFMNPPADDLTSSDTNTSAPRVSVIAFRDHANVSIKMAD